MRILTKDLAREAVRQLESKSKEKSKTETARADVDRIVRLAQELRGNGVHAKAVFACSGQGFWREYDLPAQLSGTQLLVDRHFHLKPLAHLLGAFPSLGVVLVDRHRARLFDLRLGELTEREGFFHPLSRRGRSDGFAGYDGGHAERRVADEARQHFKFVADFIQDALEKGLFENWILGCQETHWSQFAAAFASRCFAEVAWPVLRRGSSSGPGGNSHAGGEDFRRLAGAALRRSASRNHELRPAATAAASPDCAACCVSLEMGEIQTLLIGENYVAQAVECTGCGHLDAHLVSYCPVCGRETREVVDVAEAILPWVIRHDIELFYVKDDPEFDNVGNIAALLRFRSAQGNNNVQPITEARKTKSLGRQAGLVGRYRGAASG